MEPTPLSTPNGEVLAHACPTCRKVYSMTALVTLEGTATLASRCCICKRCNEAPLPPVRSASYCEACDLKIADEIRTQNLRHALAEANHLATSKDPDKSEQLRQWMRQTSERLWAAGWLTGLEYTLYLHVREERTREFDGGTIYKGEWAQAQAWSEACGGWWAWRNDNTYTGVWFYPLEEWIPMYTAYILSKGFRENLPDVA
jgi:hypothetical protein